MVIIMKILGLTATEQAEIVNRGAEFFKNVAAATKIYVDKTDAEAKSFYADVKDKDLVQKYAGRQELLKRGLIKYTEDGENMELTGK